MNAVQSQSYGPEARGGASKAEVIIAAEEIDYPKVAEADLCL
jgi:2-oxoglutarate ferredoxin oxidoreductase subunit gamma